MSGVVGTRAEPPDRPDDDPKFLERLRREQERRRHTERPKEADD